ncbi:hypothetical protein N8S49_21490 [Enterobacter hormaechei subsp. xiangfangensis]|nr:hypothetical protein [Enterobacter hormaechei subsp. xiangfangensis]
MHTQTIFELSQEAERLLQLALNNLDSLKSMPIAKLDSTTAAMSGVNNNVLPLHFREGANKRGNSSRLTQSFHFFMFEPIFSPVNALNQPI